MRVGGPGQGVFAVGADARPAFALGAGLARAAFLAPADPLGHGAKG